MPIIKLYSVEDEKMVPAGMAMPNCIVGLMPVHESFLLTRPGFKIVQLINKDQVYITNEDFNKLKEYWNQ